MIRKRLLLPLLAVVLLLSACSAFAALAPGKTVSAPAASAAARPSLSAAGSPDFPESLPVYTGEPYVAVHDNNPFFSAADMTDLSYETYSDLDELGRCGSAMACIGGDLMPTEPRGSIREIHPSGWKQAMYSFVDGEALYNRCHLIGWQLTAEDANAENLITGTRTMNTKGMLPFENMVADYIRETGNHVLYRVTPLFQDDELVARGVLMEAKSVEDDGEGILFCVYAFNVEPGVVIDYATGTSALENAEDTASAGSKAYVLNLRNHKFHLSGCASVARIGKSNRQDYVGSREALIAEGYEPCGSCQP